MGELATAAAEDARTGTPEPVVSARELKRVYGEGETAVNAASTSTSSAAS